MAKIVLDNVTGGYDLAVINSNFDKIETELQNKVLYRDNLVGEPNTVEQNIDLNGNKIYNTIPADTDTGLATLGQVKGLLSDSSLYAGFIAQLIEEHTATAGQTTFTLTSFSYIPSSRSLKVYVNGLLQDDGEAYTETSSTVVTFTEGLQDGDVVRFLKNDSQNTLIDPTIRNQLISVSDDEGADMVRFVQAGTGAVTTRTVRDKLREFSTNSDHASSTENRDAAASLTAGGFWDDDVPAGRLFRFVDRAFFGDAASTGGGKKSPGVEKSWVGNSAGGYMTYFESRSTVASFSKKGAVAFSGASQSSDNVETGELNTIGGAFFANNNNSNAADKKSAWAIYGHASQVQPNKFTTALELDVCSTQTLVSVSPYSMGAAGTTATSWFGVGGETAQQLVATGGGASLTNVSCALGVINSASAAAGNRYEKGIVFQASAISGTDGVTGTGVAVEMAKGHEITWKFSSGANAFGAKIRSDGADAATQQRLVFTSGAFQVKGVQSDLTTENILFSVSAPVAGAAAVNYLSLSPGTSGGTTTTINAAGVDTNIDIRIVPKGSGLLRTGYSTGAASVPANFAANRYLAFKDSSGGTYYIPCMGATW